MTVLLLAVVVAGVLVAGGLLAFMHWALADWDGDDPDAVGTTGFRELVGAHPGDLRDELKVVTWNVAFGGGAGKQPTETHGRGEVLANLAGVAARVQAERPDVVFLQEVDRPSHRSGDVDQLQILQDTLGLPYACFVTTWRVRHLPFPYWPPEKQMGRVWSGQAILSRFPVEGCRRVALPQPEEQPWWYNRFFLHRALQVARLALPGGRRLTVVNLHLEAFSQPNREEHARLLVAELARIEPDQPLVVAGDFNAVPADAPQKNGFVDEPGTDFTTDATVATVRSVPGLREVFLDDAPGTPARDTMTFPADAPTRRLDYIYARGLPASTARRVIPETAASDHRPVVAAFPWP